jgi:MFS family permease
MALTVGGMATVLARAPAGELVDVLHAKRTLIALASAVVAMAAVVMALFPSFWPVTLAQVGIGAADAVFPAALAAISLGIVGRAGFTARVGRNEAFNHGGNVVTAISAGAAGWLIDPSAVLWIVAALALAVLLPLVQRHPTMLNLLDNQRSIGPNSLANALCVAASGLAIDKPDLRVDADLNCLLPGSRQ